MAVPSRAEAVATLQDGQAELDASLARLSDEELVKPATIGGGDWSAKDLLGHIAAWEELALVSWGEWKDGRMPDVERPEGPMSGSDQIDAYNARSVEEHRSLSLEEVRRRSAASHAELISAIESMPDGEWLAPSSYRLPDGRTRTLAELLGSLTAAPKRAFGHAFAHLPDLEAYVRSVAGS